MSKYVFINNAVSTLAAGINDTDTSIFLQTSDGAKFSSPTGLEIQMVTLTDAAGNIEICRVTSRAIDTLTVVRGEEGTVARSWLSGDSISHRNTAAALTQFVQNDGSQDLKADLNADLVDGYEPANTSGGLAINNTALNVDLNADQVDGIEGAEIMLKVNNLADVDDLGAAKQVLGIGKYREWQQFIGDGSDGTVIHAVNTTLDSGEYDFVDYTLNSGIILDTTELSDGMLVIRCTGKCTIIGTIDLSGRGSLGGVAVNSQVGAKGDNGTFGGTGGGGGQDDNLDGGDGGDNEWGPYIVEGGLGRTGTNGAGLNGNEMTARQIESILANGFTNYIKGGSGGGAGTSTDGSPTSGANGGGVVVIIADEIDFQTGAIIDCSGDDAEDEPVLSAAGGGGGGGMVLLVSRVLTANDGTTDISGGLGGDGVVTYDGGDGADGYFGVITNS